MKRICVLFLMFLCARALGQSFVSNGIVYGITSGQTVEVLPYFDMLNSAYSGAITIPQTVEHDGTTYTVTALAESAFEDCGNVTSLTLPPTVRIIGPYCFYNCNFTSLQLPDSLRVLGDHAFLYSHINSLHLPAYFEEYGNATFWARSLTSITVDEDNPNYRSINGWLYSKDSLTLCIVPDGVTGTINVPSYVRHIGTMAFGFNSRTTAVSLPEGLESIGAFAFNCCANVNNIVIPSTVRSIGICPFSYCPQLSNLSIASGNSHYVTDGLMLYSIGYDTLVSCHKSGATVTLNPNVKVLGGFENNTWVRNIAVPAGVTEISDNCFNGCAFSNIALPAHMKRIGAHAFSENSNLARVVMPETLHSMGEGAFSWCEGLTSIVIPDSLRVIPNEAFNSCPQLRSVTWGNSVEDIGYAAFWAMAAVNLDLPPTLRKLDDLAFAACANHLRTVTIRSQLDTMGEAIFRHANLNKIRFTVGNPPVSAGQGPLYDIGRIDSIAIPCGSLGTWLNDAYWGQFADKLVEDCNGIEDTPEMAFAVYPNPASSRLTIGGVDGKGMAELVNAAGQTVLSHEINGTSVEIDVSSLPRGPYFLRLLTSDSIATHKVILQ